MTTVSVPARGCGSPTVGGLYLATKTSPNGIPFQWFLLDPTIPVAKELDLSPLGMTMKDSGFTNDEGKPIYHIFDQIGEEYYPNVWDWIRECELLGFHRKISSNFPFHLLTRESRYYAVHTKAGFVNPEPYRKNMIQTDLLDTACEKDHLPGETCIDYLTNDLLGDPIEETDRGVNVDCPSFSYWGYAAPTETPKYVKSIFLSMPIGAMGEFKFYTDKSKDIEARKEKIVKKLPEFMDFIEEVVSE